MFTLSHIPCWYVTFALLISLYQAWRGFMLQWRLNAQLIPEIALRIFLLCLADAFTFFVSSLSGFLSLFFLYQLGNQQLDASRVTLIIFFGLYGILGITAKLPELLAKLNLPGILHGQH
jgi:hypothetical protein